MPSDDPSSPAATQIVMPISAASCSASLTCVTADAVHTDTSSAYPQLIDSTCGLYCGSCMAASSASTQPFSVNWLNHTGMVALGHRPASTSTSSITSPVASSLVSVGILSTLMGTTVGRLARPAAWPNLARSSAK